MEGIRSWALQISIHMCRFLLAPFFHLKVQGSENIPRTTAFVLLPKHQRWEDIPLLSLACPRTLYYIAKDELFRNPVVGYILRSVGGIPLNRQNPLESRDSLKALIRFLEHGEGVVVFPEGTYYRNSMGPGRPGVVRLILSRLTLPFIPVGITYSREGWRTLVHVRFGNPIHPDPNETPYALVDSVMGEIARLSGLQMVQDPSR